MLVEEYPFETVLLTPQGEVIERPVLTAQRMRLEVGEVCFQFVFIPGGLFRMGSLRGGFEDERPQHPVSLAPFWMGQALITQSQWQAVVKKLPPCRFHGVDLPVDNVSWRDAVDFCAKLGKRAGGCFRLPSEAEWEYACRAGTHTPFWTGETITTGYANYVGENYAFGQGPQGVYRHTTTPAGTFPLNPRGLYDLHGNLWQFCADRWHADYSGAPTGGSAWDAGGEAGYRAARGGSWHEPPTNCRSTARLRCKETEQDDFYGFRLVYDPEGKV